MYFGSSKKREAAKAAFQEAKNDFNDGVEDSDDLEYKLDVADGKIMLMTKILHASFSTLLQMTYTKTRRTS